MEALQDSTFDDVLIGLASPNGAASYDNEHFGLEGNDRIEDTRGENTLHGGLGNDPLIGSGTLPALWGQGSLLDRGEGNDSLGGGAISLNGGDTLVGGLGDDGDDTNFGAAGTDAANRLTGVLGIDTLKGGGGDVYVIDRDDTSSRLP